MRPPPSPSSLPALELIDSRIRDWKITLVDTVADNASSGGLILGNSPHPLAGLDLALGGCLLTKNGRLAETGAGGAVLGHPLNALVWLANTVARQGVTLRAGDVVLPGSITASMPVTAGDTVTATFAGLGSVTRIRRAHSHEGRDRRSRQHRHRPAGQASAAGAARRSVHGRRRP